MQGVRHLRSLAEYFYNKKFCTNSTLGQRMSLPIAFVVRCSFFFVRSILTFVLLIAQGPDMSLSHLFQQNVPPENEL